MSQNASEPSTNATMCESLKDQQVHQIFGLAVPNEEHWQERTSVWYVFFYLMLIIYGLLFICLGVACIILLWKRHLAQRFKIKTFIAIDLALMTLGFSRALFFVLDPWGQSGYFTCQGCIIASRLIAALAFPSLTASYTLVFITLWLSARLQLGGSCVQNLKVLIPLCFGHYVVAILFEIVGSLPVSKYPVVFLLISCEAVFSTWGFFVCFGFLFAGVRLLRSVKKSARSSSIVCRDSPSMTRHELINKSRFQNRAKERTRGRTQSNMKLKALLRDHHRRAIRKVTIITYITATLGMLYSVVSFINLVLLSLNLFHKCPGYIDDKKLHPGVWLALRYVVLTLELFMGTLLTYSISDYKPVVGLLRTLCGLRRERTVVVVPDGTSTDFKNSPVFSPRFTATKENFFEESSCSVVEPLPESPPRDNKEKKLTSPLTVSFNVSES